MKLLFRLEDEALGEKVVAELGVLGCAFCGWKRGHAEGPDLVELEGGLTEGGFGVGAADAFEGFEVCGGGGGAGFVGWREGFAGEDEGVQLAGIAVGGAELEGYLDLALGVGEVGAAQEGDGYVVVVVGVLGVGGRGALEEGCGIATLTAGGYGLVVDDLGEGETGGDEGEGVLGLLVAGGVEAGETEVEAGLEGAAVGGVDFGEGDGRLVVITLGELGFAEG